MREFNHRWRRLLSTAALVLMTAHAQEGGDLQAQILYAYQSEDSNRLADLVQLLGAAAKSAPDDTGLRYHLAHAEYRYAQLAGRERAREAETALQDCVDQLAALLTRSARSAEALALDAACHVELARHRTLEAVLLRSRARDRLRAAYQIAPRNPRVLLLMAEDGLENLKPGTAEYKQAFAQLNLASQRFDATPATDAGVPGWGHAEAYLVLGRELERRGDVIGARNSIEKALIAAPEFKAAQRQLLTLTNMAEPR
jgi:tetratricopeptide (TPR) repeat protein